MLSNWKPIELPAATEKVAVAGMGLTLHRRFVDVALSTGELLSGLRTAAVEEVPPARRLYQISVTSCVSIVRGNIPTNLQWADALCVMAARLKIVANFILLGRAVSTEWKHPFGRVL